MPRPAPTPDKDAARFASKSVRVGHHLEWRGTIDGRGRPIFDAEGKTWDARRLAYCAAYGPLPPGTTAEQLCDAPWPCVEPEHLAPVY